VCSKIGAILLTVQLIKKTVTCISVITTSLCAQLCGLNLTLETLASSHHSCNLAQKPAWGCIYRHTLPLAARNLTMLSLASRELELRKMEMVDLLRRLGCARCFS
jgi:hypothetical protein